MYSEKIPILLSHIFVTLCIGERVFLEISSSISRVALFPASSSSPYGMRWNTSRGFAPPHPASFSYMWCILFPCVYRLLYWVCFALNPTWRYAVVLVAGSWLTEVWDDVSSLSHVSHCLVLHCSSQTLPNKAKCRVVTAPVSKLIIGLAMTVIVNYPILVNYCILQNTPLSTRMHLC